MSDFLAILILMVGGAALVPLLVFVYWWRFASRERERRQKDPDFAWESTFMSGAYGGLRRAIQRGVPNLLLPEVSPPRPNNLSKRLDWATAPYAASKADQTRLRNNPWGWPLLDFAIRASLIYPVFLASLTWLLYLPTDLGGAPLFPEDAGLILRGATFGGLTLLILLKILATARPQGIFEKLEVWLPLFAVAFVVAVAFAGAGAVAGAVAFVVAVTVAFVVAGAVLWLARTPISVGARTFHLGALAYLTLISSALLTGVFAIRFADDDSIVIYVFFILLPLTNAVFDWLSYGTTLWLLNWGWQGHKAGKKNRAILATFGDIFAAMLFFFVLSLAVLFVLHLCNQSAGRMFFDLDDLLWRIERDHWQVFWVIAMIGSTLLPTFVHLVLGALSPATYRSTRYWNALIERTDEGGAGQNWQAWFALQATVVTLVPACLIAGFGWGAWTYGGVVIDFYVQVIRYPAEAWGWLAPVTVPVAL